ncbi:hypothetical protein [Cohnella cellulosilytica]|uniref:Uncharacterized protein n=1 Tax=Cohnella cellulosilytica TaxID=986710 RepID=A0ABW2FDE7_9BACL
MRNTAKVIADAKGLVKSSGLTKLNNRDVYLDTATGNLYAVDTQHGKFELTNSKGKHQEK